MKKTQVALAALALVASSAALADGVTVYGRLDTAVGKQSGSSTQFLGLGTWDTSIFGFKGSEDLGGGLKASFQLETGLNIGNGAIGNNGAAPNSTSTPNLFTRLAFVTLGSDSTGTIGLGTQFSPFVGAALGGVVNNNESFYVPLLAVAGAGTPGPFGAGGNENANTGNGYTGGFFIPNSVTYATPSFGPISAKVMTTLNAGTNENKYLAAAATYAQDALSVNLGYQKRGDSATAASDYNSWTISGAYQLSEALRLSAGYINHEASTGTETKTYNLGASYAIAPATSVSLQYARNDEDNAKQIVNVGLLHNLSKRTYAYATVSQGKNGAGTLYAVAAPTGVSSYSGYAVGIGHNF